MLKNYLRIGFRNLSSQKGYALINILGLAIGITVCLLIFLVIRFETSFDNFHSKRDHTYRVVSVFKNPEGISYEPGVPFPTAQTLRRDYPQLKNVASILSLGGSGQITVPDLNSSQPARKFKEERGVLYAEPDFFNIFDFGWLAGDKSTALNDPNSVLLTQSVADKYFGSWRNAVGRSVILENSYTFKVTGILKDMPANTDFPLRVVISYSTLKTIGFASRFADWSGIFVQHYCFIVLPEGLSAAQFNKNLVSLVNKYKPVENRNQGMALLPLKEMHFDARYSTFNQPAFSKDLIYVLALIGLFVLVIACVNFINLATAQAVNRSKEVGIRKVLGSTRRQLVAQFLMESATLIILAAFLAVGICLLAIPFLNQLMEMSVGRAFLKDPVVVEALAGIIIGTTLLAGFYPALVISGFNPVTAFKNKAAANRPGKISLRRVLVVLQFTISQALIIGVLIIMGQMEYFRAAPMGFDKSSMLIAHIPGDSGGHAKIESLRGQLLTTPGISKVSFSFASPADDNNWYGSIRYNNVEKRDLGVILKWADASYFDTYRLHLEAGRFYDKSDTVRDLVVNETFLKKLGIRDGKLALGAKVDVPSTGQSGSIVGVVKDFNIGSLHDAMSPVLMGPWKATYETVNIKIASVKSHEVIAGLEKIWTTNFPDQIFEYRFLDDNIAAYYKQENELSALYKISAGVAIFLSCLGLYSLASFMAVQRSKEVGIRKTLGASVSQIVYLFSREFTLLILIAFVLAAPLAWYFMQEWLQNYAFHYNPGPALPLLAVSISLAIAWISVGYKALRAARVNPVESLRAE